jgi:hypothetical protein
MQIAGTSFPVRINAVDAFWNIVNTATNWVDIYSTSDNHATLPGSAALVEGYQTFNVAFSAGGNQTLTAEDVIDDAIGDDTSPEISVIVTYFTFQVVSLHGTGSPKPGIYTNALNAVLTNSVSSPVIQGGTQYVCTGWVMTGNTPQSGTSNHFIMAGTNNSGLTWLWTTNYQFSATSGANGGVTGATNGWYALGGEVSVTAAPMPYYNFAGWTGDSLGDTNSAEMSLLIDRPRTVSAAFAAKLASKGTPQYWLAQFGLTNGGINFDSAEIADKDGDRLLNWQEYVAGTDPTNPASYFHIKNVSKSASYSLYYPTVAGRYYTLLFTTNLVSGGWKDVPGQTNWGDGSMSWMNDTNSALPRFYRLNVTYPAGNL